MPWRDGVVLLRICDHCQRVDVQRLEESYIDIEPPLPWSEAEARAALLLGTAVMDRPVLEGDTVDYSLLPVLLYEALGGEVGRYWFNPVTDRYELRWSTGAPAPEERSISSRTPSRTWHH